MQAFEDLHTNSLLIVTLTLDSYQAYAMQWFEMCPGYVRDIEFDAMIVNESDPNTTHVHIQLNILLLSMYENLNVLADVYNYTPSMSIPGLREASGVRKEGLMTWDRLRLRRSRRPTRRERVERVARRRRRPCRRSD